jgi:hypothetical protein
MKNKMDANKITKKIMNKNDQVKARRLCKEVRKICDKYGMSFFFVTDGASAYNNASNSDAVRTARNNHIQWELKNDHDPYEDWTDEE